MKKTIYTKKYAVDLHLHTIYSDGADTPTKLVETCALNGLEVISVTDHDIISGFNEVKAESERWGLKVLPGVEISTDSCHILGYCFDVNDETLNKTLEYSRHVQDEIVKRRIEGINLLGIPITFEDVRNYFPDSRLGKGNIGYTLLANEASRKIMGNMSLEAVVKNIIKTAPLDKSRIVELTPLEAIYAIHHAGGIAVLAHPSRDFDSVSVLDDYYGWGLDGIEIQPRYSDSLIFSDYGKKFGFLETYGSDFHGARYTKRPLLDNIHKIRPFW